MVEKLIRCVRCNQVIPYYNCFGDFKEYPSLPGVEWSSEDLLREKDFYFSHQNHGLEEIIIDRETIVSDKPCYEPIKIIYFEASNGQQRFLIRRTKKSLDQSSFYEIIPGQLQFAGLSSPINEND